MTHCKTTASLFAKVVLPASGLPLSDQARNYVNTDMRVSGSIFKLYDIHCKKYMGLFHSFTLSQLVEEFSITLSSRISAATDPERKTDEKKQQESSYLKPHNQRLLAHVIIYGHHRDMNKVGQILSLDGLYLQHPVQCDLAVPYKNPQYFLPPGMDMPQLQDLAIAGHLNISEDEEQLEFAQEKEVLQAFDGADGPDTYINVQQSPRLRTQLRESVNIDQDPFFSINCDIGISSRH